MTDTSTIVKRITQDKDGWIVQDVPEAKSVAKMIQQAEMMPAAARDAQLDQLEATMATQRRGMRRAQAKAILRYFGR